MQQIILCKCVFGGYDFCECGGNGVIIIHGVDDYIRLSKKNTILSHTPKIVSLIDRIKAEVSTDSQTFDSIIKNFKNCLPKRALIIEKLKLRIQDWRDNLIKINDEALRKEVEKYIETMNGEVDIIREEFEKASRRRPKGNYIPKIARDRKRARRNRK